MYDFIIIGAGASGMVAAISLAQSGKRVCLIEYQSRGGKKILASGNGHCNIANVNVSSKHYKANNTELLRNLLNSCSPQKIVEFFDDLGLEIVAKADGKMYPKSNQASSVLALLEARVKKLKIDTFYNAKDLKIKKGFSITFNSNSIKSKNLIIATGSEAAPQLGSTNFGLEVAKSFGHSIIKPLPALVPLTSKDSICKVLNGLKLDVNARLLINNQEKTSINGDILFRDYGVSGLAILDISLEAIRHIDNKQDVKISIDFFKELNKKELLDYLKSKINKQRALSVNLWLGGFLHTKLANFLAKELNLEHLSEDRLNTKLLKELTNKLKNYTISIDGIREFKYAEVALGGVNSQEINPKTFESKKQKGLFFIGEVLDVVGNRGGYNFYFAWCSGMKVGLF